MTWASADSGRVYARLIGFCRRLTGRLFGLKARSMAAKDVLGRRGEGLALKYLAQQGYRRVAQNYRVPGGEVDLIMQDRDTIVFIEVKTRRDESYTRSEEIINSRKRRHIETAAKRYIKAHRLYDRPCRFDTVAVVIPDDGEISIRHQADAFRFRR